MKGLSAEARGRLVARARAELPRPGDPRLLMDDLARQDLAGPEALEVLSRTTLAWVQLRDLKLERVWQGTFGWFLARNLMVLGLLVLVLVATLGPPLLAVEGALAGAALYYLIVMALSPLRLRPGHRREAGILQAYGQDLSRYLEQLEA